MYDLYKMYKGPRIFFGFVMVASLVIFLLLYVGEIMKNGFSIGMIFVFLVIVFFGFIVFGIISAFNADPYEKIKKMKEQNPMLVNDMENDFMYAVEFGHRIYRGNRYYFFKGDDFFVIPIGQVMNIEVRKIYRRRIGVVDICKFTSAAGEVEVDIPNMIQSREDSMRYLNQMAYESRIMVKNNDPM